jgi:hypothetical protein
MVLVLVIEKRDDRLRAPPSAEHEQEHEKQQRTYNLNLPVGGDQRENKAMYCQPHSALEGSRERYNVENEIKERTTRQKAILHSMEYLLLRACANGTRARCAHLSW